MGIKNCALYYTLSAVLTIAVSLLVRYVYRLYPGIITGIISATNSSIFEQMKALLWPCILFMVIHEGIFRSGDFEEQCIYLLVSLITVPIAILLLDKILENYNIINLSASSLGIVTFYVICYVNRMKKNPLSVFEKISAPILMITIITVFIAFSFNPPKNELFVDPQTGRYGMDFSSVVMSKHKVYF